MPTYVYRCKSCEHELEILQKISDDPLTECPACQGQLVRLLFPPSIVFKGSGFHINDYPSSSSGGGRSESKPAESKTEEKPSSKEPAAASKD